jgi:hypothetical protein
MAKSKAKARAGRKGGKTRPSVRRGMKRAKGK